VAVAGALVAVAAVAVATSGAPSNAAFGRGLVELLIVGTPIAAGLYALRAPLSANFGVALLLVGFLWSLTALAESSVSGPHTIGRLATWLTFPCVVYLMLAFPRGRIDKGLDRVLFFGVVAVMLLLFFGTAPFVQAFPTKTLWSTCTTDCPANALFVLDRQPAFMTDVVRVREWLIELLWLGLFLSMFRRWQAGSPLQQRTMGPAFVAGALLGLLHIAHITARQLGAPTDTVIALSSVWTILIVAVCAAFVYGLFRRRMLLAGALARLSVTLGSSSDQSQVRAALADALSDSTIELLFYDRESGRWLDARGRAVEWPASDAAGRASTVIGAHAGVDEVVLLHDAALRDDQDLVDGAGAMVLAGWRHQALESELATAMGDLEDSRWRIAEAADLERARIERDLHDGAQQRLIALRINLALAEENLAADPAAALERLHELGHEADDALEELRSLAQGVYPSLLADRGLDDALRSLAAGGPVPVHVAVDGLTRHAIEIESAVYFTCVEALQNAMKHAGADAIWIRLEQTPHRLRFEVRDDGAGFVPDRRGGRGLRNMRDRIEAVRGSLTIDAAPGRGTVVAGSIELP
jgi:signal transduction histidine kinase